jgi:hypothetical protein
MKIKELSKILKKYPEDMDVMVLCDEFGYYHPLERRRIKNKMLWFGHTSMDVKRLKRSEYPGPPKWRVKYSFFEECDVKEKKKVW